MTEMEELKANTEKAKVHQTLDAIGKYIHQLSDECDERFKMTLRADALVMFTFVGYFAVMLIALFGDLPYEVRRMHTELIFCVELVAIFRSWYFTKQWREKEGEWTGATQILRLLGMLHPEKERGVKNKKKLWSEGMAMVKRWAEEKAAQMKKGFAPA